MKLKDACYLEGQHIKKQRLHFVEVMDKEAWFAAIPGVKKSWTQLSENKNSNVKEIPAPCSLQHYLQ